MCRALPGGAGSAAQPKERVADVSEFTGQRVGAEELQKKKVCEIFANPRK